MSPWRITFSIQVCYWYTLRMPRANSIILLLPRRYFSFSISGSSQPYYSFPPFSEADGAPWRAGARGPRTTPDPAPGVPAPGLPPRTMDARPLSEAYLNLLHNGIHIFVLCRWWNRIATSKTSSLRFEFGVVYADSRESFLQIRNFNNFNLWCVMVLFIK